MKAIDRLRTLTRLHDLRDRPDAELVRVFADRRDEAAFELLVRRHGPLVLGVCRRALGDHAAADDAFQATFLLLARRAPALREPAGVARWLYGTAARTAREALRQDRRRRRRERRAARPEATRPDFDDTSAAVDAAVRRLPEPYRSAVLLCDLGGFTRDEAARELGVPAGTVASRQSRGRQMLADDLTRRGLTLGVLAMPVSAGLCESTVRVACLVAGGEAASAVAPAAAALLGGTSMALTLKLLAAVGAVGLATAGGLALSRPAQPPADPPPAKSAEAAPRPRPAETPAEKLARLKREYKTEEQRNMTLIETTPGGLTSYGVTPFAVEKYLTPLAELGRGTEDAVAFDAFVLTLDICRHKGDDSQATVDALLARFAKTDYARRMVMPVCNAYGDRQANLLKFAAMTTDRAVAGNCLLTAGEDLDRGTGWRRSPDTPADWVAELAARRERAIALYNRVIAEYPDEADEGGGSFASRAKQNLGRIASASPGLPAPKTVGVDLDGKPLDLADFKGKTVVLHFWQPGAVGDREDKVMNTAAGKYADRGVVVLGVTGGWEQLPDRYRKSAADRGHTWRSWFDPIRLDPADPKKSLGSGPIHEAWFTRSFPTTHIIAPDGVIDAVNVGVDGVLSRLAELLKPPAKP